MYNDGLMRSIGKLFVYLRDPTRQKDFFFNWWDILRDQKKTR